MTGVAWTFTSDGNDDPVLATAIHAGHELRDEVSKLMVLADADRRREEDPYTDRWTTVAASRVVVDRSRFEFDLNRPRDKAIYRTPDDAWGLVVWSGELPEAVVETSLGLYDAFYAELGDLCDSLVERHGRFVVFDLHSYNHHRSGHDALVDDPDENPEINVGTASIEDSWRPVITAVMDALRSHPFDGGHLDVRENVKFSGGNMSRWINSRYGAAGCSIAIEMKKIFMDEWTDDLEEAAFIDIGEAVMSAADAARDLISSSRGRED